MRTLAGSLSVSVVLIASLLLWTCTEHPTTSPHLDVPRASISDAVHGGGNAGFYFLPPLVAAPQPTGQFDGSLLPYTVVEVCYLDLPGCTVIARFSSTDGSSCVPKDDAPPAADLLRVDPVEETYVVNWKTGECYALDASATYRIRVLVGGTELGHVDLDVVGSGGELKDVNTQEYAGLVPGRTLPIKFRTEQGAVFPMGPDGGTVVAADGRLVLRVPSGALTSFVGMTVRAAHPATDGSDGQITGTAWDLQPEGLSFLEPVELDLAYEPGSLPEGLLDPTASIVVATLEDENWFETVSTVDADVHRVRGAIYGFSVKAAVLKTISLDASPSSLTLHPSETGQLAATLRDARGVRLSHRMIAQTSSDQGIATVESDGTVHAVSVGSATIRMVPVLHVPPGVNRCALPYALCAWPGWEVPVLVQAPVASVEVVPPSPGIGIGEDLSLTAILKDALGNVLINRSVSWESRDPSIATVSPVGLVTGVAAGNVVVLATSEGIAGSATVTVASAPPAVGPWKEVTTGQNHTCGLQADGQAFCWGENSVGQLGASTSTLCASTPCSTTPIPVAGGYRFVLISAGLRYTCGLAADGAAYCWGDNSWGQLGVGSTVPSSPTPLPVAGGLRFSQLSAGQFHVCGLVPSGDAYCWGNNTWGQVGNGNPRRFATEVPRLPNHVLGGHAFTAIAAAGSHTCALTGDAVAYCWGGDFVGQLGTPVGACTTYSSLSCSAVPVPVSTDLRFAQVTAGGVVSGGSHSCALTDSGEAYCWGTSQSGELGVGSAVPIAPTPVPVVGDLTFSRIRAGASTTCGVLANQTPMCWGRDFFGEIGDGFSGIDRLVPTPVAGDLVVGSVAPGHGTHTCAVTAGGDLYCWGWNVLGQIGDGSTAQRLVPTRVVDP